jgi:hypothetical protein
MGGGIILSDEIFKAGNNNRKEKALILPENKVMVKSTVLNKYSNGTTKYS